ncbi:unnamed protein product [Gongylonema pulchrum]|uniref:Transposase n=1 Tax=Gongylonema pulchrum TaxID=637853 RepID=A0A183D6F4_9BILA|nr:unnamed protein product [Gongylonema pulchrum]
MTSIGFPIPTAANGRTLVGGRFALDAQQASLVLMEGEILANRWALFYLNQPSLIFSNIAQYMFVDEKQTVGIDLTEKLLLKLTGMTKENKAHDFNRTTVVCKVEREKGHRWPKDSSVRECLAQRIDEPLVQLFSPSQESTKTTVLELFE